MNRDAEAPSAASPGGVAAGAPRSIGRYRVVAEKGASSFGTVYLAEHTETAQPVAVRLLSREVSNAAAVGEVLRRRAHAVVEASRAHPSLVSVLEYGTTEDGRFFAVMERVEGRRLSEVLGAQKPDVSTALQLAMELGGPIETLHNLAFVHGAVRPTNFVVSADGAVKLLDVELIAIRDVPALRPLVAERARATYLAPEQLQSRPITDKTDVYSFGATLYHMLGGAPPFRSASRQEVVDKHLREEAPRLRRRQRSVPALIDTLIAEALNKWPEQRPYMQKLLNDLALGASAQRKRWRAAGIAAGLIVTAAISATIAWMLFALAPDPSATPPTPADVDSAPTREVQTAPPTAAPSPGGASGQAVSVPPLPPASQPEAGPRLTPQPARPLPPAPTVSTPAPAIAPPAPPVAKPAPLPPSVATPTPPVSTPTPSVARPTPPPPAVAKPTPQVSTPAPSATKPALPPPGVVTTTPPTSTPPTSAVRPTPPPPVVTPTPSVSTPTLPPPVATPAPAPAAPRATAPPPARVEREAPRPAPAVDRPAPAPSAPTAARPTPTRPRDEGDPDPNAVIDWLLKNR